MLVDIDKEMSKAYSDEKHSETYKSDKNLKHRLKDRKKL